ncbi:uncharacterized protein LOC136025178 [Artemia franciscana]
MSKKAFFSNRKKTQGPSIQFVTAQVDSAGSANRPAATKSAGVIGKWGITSFTSLRSSCISSDAAMNGSKYSIGKKAKTVPLPVFNSETAVAPAPKKFFKSRGQTEENIAPSSFACHVKESTNGELQDNLSRVPLTAVSPPQKSQSLSAGWNGSGLDCRRPMYTGDILIGQSSSESNSSEDDSYSPKGKKTKGNKKTRKGKKIIVTPSCRTLRAKKVLELEDPPPPQMDFDSFSEPKVDSMPSILSPATEQPPEPESDLKPKPAIKLRIVRNKSDSSLETQLTSPELTPSKNYSFHESPADFIPKLKIRFKGLDPPPDLNEKKDDSDMKILQEETEKAEKKGNLILKVPREIFEASSIKEENRPKRSARSRHVSYQELDPEIEVSDVAPTIPKRAKLRNNSGVEQEANESERALRNSSRSSHVSYLELDTDLELGDLPVLGSASFEGKRSTRGRKAEKTKHNKLPILENVSPEKEEKVVLKVESDLENKVVEPLIISKHTKRGRKAAESVNVDEMNLKTEAPSLDEDLPLSKRNNRTKRTVKPSENVRQLSIQEESDLKIASDGQLDLESCQKDVPEMKELSLVVDEKLQNKEVNNIDCSIIDAVEEKLASLFGSADGNETSAVSNIGLEKKVENDLLKEVIEPEVEQIESQQVLPESCDTVVSASEVVKDSQATLILSQESDSSQSLAGPQYNLKDSQETVDFEKSAIKEEGDMQPVEETDSSTNQCIEKEKVSFDNAELFENLECRKMEVNYGKIDITSEMSQNSPVSFQEECPPASVSSIESFDSSQERVLQPKKAFFKNRSQRPGEYTSKKAFSMYKHVWVDDPVMEEIQQSKSLDSNNQPFKFDDNFEEPKLTRVSTWPKTKAFVDEEELITSVKCPKRAKELYTVVKNVKHAHQMQEQGEFQEYQDDVDYILDALQSGNPVATRCLAAISLAQKCLAPGFRMHLRAHGTVAKFFHALRDAPSSLSVGLCTATVMFVLSLDRLNVDLDRSSLELMLNLLDSETESTQSVVDIEYERNRIKVKQICDEVKKKKQAMHLTTDNLTTAQLAMETLLSLTSRRAGEWFKEELRELGGIEHLIETVSECVECVSATRDWPKQKLEKVVKLDRCLRVLENVTNLNEDNQIHLLEWKNGRFMNTLLELFRTITFTLGGVGEFCGVLKTSDVDATIKDVLLNILKFLVNMTHDYKNKSFGSSILGKEPLMFESCLVVLFVVPPRIPEENRFDLIVMVLSVIINLVENAPENRNRFMKLIAPATEDQFLCDPISACQALVRLFFECEMSAKQEERKTDDILDGKVLITREDSQNTLDPEEMVKQLLHKAGRHMEDTMVAAYIALILGYLMINSIEHTNVIREMLPDKNFQNLLTILKKFFKFVNLTSNPGNSMKGLKAMDRIIQFMESADMPPPSQCLEESFITDCSLDSSV